MSLTAPTGATQTLSAGLLFFGLAATVGTALGFEHIGGYLPCMLCLEQRTPYYIGVPLMLLALLAVSGFFNKEKHDWVGTTDMDTWEPCFEDLCVTICCSLLHHCTKCIDRFGSYCVSSCTCNDIGCRVATKLLLLLKGG